MRRSNKASSTSKKKRTTHLDLPSHDNDGSSKVKKRKSASSKSTIAVAVLCGIAALGTLFFVSNKVFQASKGQPKSISGSHSLPHRKRGMEQKNSLLPPDSIYRTKIQDIHGDWQELSQYAGSVR